MKRNSLFPLVLSLGFSFSPAISRGGEARTDLVAQLGKYRESDWVRQLEITSDDRYILLGDSSHGIRVLDAQTGRVVRNLAGNALDGDLRYLPEIDRLVSTGDCRTRIWDFRKGKLLKEIRQRSHSQFMHDPYIDSEQEYLFANNVKYGLLL